LVQVAILAQHQRIVVRKESTPLRRATRQHQKDVWDKARFFLGFQDAGFDVVG
jgi:hypothetical protein